MVANIYYAQPLIGPISASLHMSDHAAGLIVTMTQVGYGAGLLLIAPLGDRIENRALVVSLILVAGVALGGAALSTAPLPFLAASLLIGIASVAVQVMVPYASHLAPDAVRGRVVGDIMSGLMLGIMLSRPVASFVTQATSWHVIFAASAILMAVVALVLRLALPARHPQHGVSYPAMLASMAHLARTEPVLQRRAFYQACLFGSFSLCWTTVPLLLAGQYGLSQNGIALFALAGVAGAIAAPIAGRAADRGHGDRLTPFAMLAATAAFLISLAARPGSPWGVGLLVGCAIMLDFGITACFVVGQRTIFSLPAQFRSRLNGLYLAAFFMGGALCSGLGAWAYAQGGWPLSSAIGIVLGASCLLVHLLVPPARSPEAKA